MSIFAFAAQLATLTFLESDAQLGLPEVWKSAKFRLTVGEVTIGAFAALTLNILLLTLSIWGHSLVFLYASSLA